MCGEGAGQIRAAAHRPAKHAICEKRSALAMVLKLPEICPDVRTLTAWLTLFLKLAGACETKVQRVYTAASDTNIQCPSEDLPKCSAQQSHNCRGSAEQSESIAKAVAHVLDAALAKSSPEEVMCTLHGVPLRRRDFSTLSPGGWLNDEIINSYFRLVQNHAQADQRQSDGKTSAVDGCWCTSSFFWPRLEKNGYASVQRWARRAGIEVSELRAMLIPLHLNGTHWALAVIDFHQKGFLYFDSLGHQAPRNLIPRLNEYLSEEMRLHDVWPLLKHDSIPNQRNTSDCGAFACMYAKLFAEGLPLLFETDVASVDKIRRNIAGALLCGHL